MRYAYQIHRVTHARDVGSRLVSGRRTFWGGSGAGSGWFRDGSGMVPDSYKDVGAGFGGGSRGPACWSGRSGVGEFRDGSPVQRVNLIGVHWLLSRFPSP